MRPFTALSSVALFALLVAHMDYLLPSGANRTCALLRAGATLVCLWRACARVGLAATSNVSPRTLPHWMAVLAVTVDATAQFAGWTLTGASLPAYFATVGLHWLALGCMSLAALMEG